MQGLQFLTSRKVEEKVDLVDIENNFGFSLPPLFKLFVSTFHLGKKYPFKSESFLNPKYNDYYNCAGPLYYPLADNEKWFLSVSYIESIEQILNDWKSSLKNENEWTNFGFLRIAKIGQGGGLYIGTRPENIEAIFQVVWDYKEPYFKVADNIFEFMQGFILTKIDESLVDGLAFSKLYKNWGEEFWRMRE